MSLAVHIGACAAVVLAHCHPFDPIRTPPRPIKILPQRASMPTTQPCPKPEIVAEPVAPVPLVDASMADASATESEPAAEFEPEPFHANRPQRVLPEPRWAAKRLLAKQGNNENAEPPLAASAAPAMPAPVSARPATPAARLEQAIAKAKVPTVVPGTNAPPTYPRIARRRRYEGTVLLRIRCNAQGHVTSVVVANSSGYSCLDEAAATAVRRWRFEHGPGHIDQPIHFQLRPAGAQP